MMVGQSVILGFYCNVFFIFFLHFNCIPSFAVSMTIETDIVNKEDKCDSVDCPNSDDCPRDSFRSVNNINTDADGCCSTYGNCQCLPMCQPLQCPPNTSAVIELEASGKPGQCCPLYRCEDFENGLEIESEDNDDLNITKIDGINNLTLESAVGCMTMTHGLVKHGFNWTTLNSCTICVCNDGIINCHTPACKPCVNLKAVTLRDPCCPVCEVYEQPNYCPPIPTCSERCTNGNKLNEDGCFTCKCKDDNDEKYSKFKLKVNVKVNLNLNVNMSFKNHEGNECISGVNGSCVSSVEWNGDKCTKCQCKNGCVECINKTCIESCHDLGAAMCCSCLLRDNNVEWSTMVIQLLMYIIPSAFVVLFFLIIGVYFNKSRCNRKREVRLHDIDRSSPHYLYLPTGYDNIQNLPY